MHKKNSLLTNPFNIFLQEAIFRGHDLLFLQNHFLLILPSDRNSTLFLISTHVIHKISWHLPKFMAIPKKKGGQPCENLKAFAKIRTIIVPYHPILAQC
jgi:hypothetical protein